MRRAIPVLLLALGLAVAATARAANPVRISQVYGGGGGTYSCDYVELFNNSDAPVDIGGWSVQYGSATGTSFGSATYNWAKIPAGATIPACGYYLIRGYCSTAGRRAAGDPGPGPRHRLDLQLQRHRRQGRAVPRPGHGPDLRPAQAVAVDLVGYGTANCYETAAAPAPDASSVLVRAIGGAMDTDDNSADFAKVAAALADAQLGQPAESAVPAGLHPPDAPTLVAPLDGARDVVVPVTLAVTVSDPDADALTVRVLRARGAAAARGAGGHGRDERLLDELPGELGRLGRGHELPARRRDRLRDSAAYVAGYQDLTVAGTSRAVGGLAPETPYYYRVRAVNDGGTSGNSNTVTVTTTARRRATEFTLGPAAGHAGLHDAGARAASIAMFKAQTQWIVDNRVGRNIVAVAHEGDITDKDNTTEYDRALTRR